MNADESELIKLGFVSARLYSRLVALEFQVSASEDRSAQPLKFAKRFNGSSDRVNRASGDRVLRITCLQALRFYIMYAKKEISLPQLTVVY